MIANDSVATFSSLLQKMKIFEQRKYLSVILTFLSQQYLNTAVDITEISLLKNTPHIEGVATLIYELIKNNDSMKEHLVTSIPKSTVPALNDFLGARRSIIAALSQDEGEPTFY